MEKKMFPKRTKILFLIFGIVVVVAVILGIWNSWRLKSSAMGIPKPIAGSISGQLRDAKTQKPVTSATVVANQKTSLLGPGNNTGQTSTIKPDGVFIIGGMQNGIYTVTVTASGYEKKETDKKTCKFVKIDNPGIIPDVSLDNCNFGWIDLVPKGVGPITGTGTVSGAVFIDGSFFKSPSCNNDTACKLEINFTPAAPSGNPYNAIVNNVGYYIKSYGPPVAYVTLPAGHYTISSAKLIWTVGNSQTTYSNGKATPSAFDVKAGGRTDVRLDFTK